MQLPIFQLNVDEFDDQTGMFLVSMVDSPAMQIAAVKLSAEPGFKVGDTVMVIPGKEHMPEHKGMMFTVYEIVGNAYALQMPDGTIHRWYTVDELMSMTDESMKKKMPDMKMSELVTLKATAPDKQYLTSAVIIPDKLIYRNDEFHGEHYIQFTAQDIEKIRNKFFQHTGNLSLSNKNHVETDTVNAQLIESWIIEDPAMDKAVALGFQGLPAGTMMATYRVLDADFWQNEVLTGNVTGFSLEGRFAETAVKLAASEENDLDTLIDWLLSTVKGDEAHV